jgi:murein DD-endopeptidase MepM/ murein hydrolase activator NlpD
LANPTPTTVQPGTKVADNGWLPNGGTITQLFGVLEYIPSLGINQIHHGIDIGAKRGDPVQAPVHGVVDQVGYDAATGAGNFVVLKLDSGETVHLYHLQDTLVKMGQDISPGTILGHVDSTGNSTGDHLHFEVQQGGTAVDPWHWLSLPFTAANAASSQSQTSSGCPPFSPLNIPAWTGCMAGKAASNITNPLGLPVFVFTAINKPQNWWRVLFIGIGVALIGTGVVIYFFKEETQVVKVVAPLAAAA